MSNGFKFCPAVADNCGDCAYNIGFDRCAHECPHMRLDKGTIKCDSHERKLTYVRK